jgi:hypothetical protein
MFHHPDHLSLQMLVGRGDMAPVTHGSILGSPNWREKIAQIQRNSNSKLWQTNSSTNRVFLIGDYEPQAPIKVSKGM